MAPIYRPPGVIRLYPYRREPPTECRVRCCPAPALPVVTIKSLVKLAIKRKQLSDPVSELTTNRLSVYLRCLNALEAAGVKTVSSQTLAQQFHLNAAQIRKDLAYFGEFG